MHRRLYGPENSAPGPLLRFAPVDVVRDLRPALWLFYRVLAMHSNPVTIPAPSWPSTIGVGTRTAPLRTVRLVWHTPLVTICTRTSLGPGSGKSSSSSLISRSPLMTKALIDRRLP